MAIERRRFVIRGRVQGVGFRYFTERAAAGLGVSGFVRNEPDGSVYCEAQGEAVALDQFAAELGRGPRFARVADVDQTALDVVADEAGFGTQR